MFSHFNRHYSVFGGGPFVYSQSFQRSLQCLWWRSPCLVILTVIIVSLVGVPLFTVSHSNGHHSVTGGGPHVFITTNLLDLCPFFSATRTGKNRQPCVSWQ